MREYEDLTGQRFYKLTVIGPTDPPPIAVKPQRYWKCKCDCGGEISVTTANLKMGRARTCRHCKENMYVGKKYGSLTIIKVLPNNGSGKVKAICKCDCGNKTIIQLRHLLKSKSPSCGKCLRSEMIGKRYGYLTVISFSHVENEKSVYECKCDCGNTVYVTGNYLRSSQVKAKSCGKCYHGFLNSYIEEYHKRCLRLSSIYTGIDRRCNDASNDSFYNYGGRGIKCNVDRFDFVRMFYDVNSEYRYGLQVDRIDNNKNYQKDNLRWVTSEVNTNNRIFNYSLSFVDIASRLLPDDSIKSVFKSNHYNISEFVVIASDKLTTGGAPLCLYIHKSLELHKHFYINRIKKFYEDCGGSITFTE